MALFIFLLRTSHHFSRVDASPTLILSQNQSTSSKSCGCVEDVPTLFLPDWNHNVIESLIILLYCGSVNVTGDIMEELPKLMHDLRFDISPDQLIAKPTADTTNHSTFGDSPVPIEDHSTYSDSPVPIEEALVAENQMNRHLLMPVKTVKLLVDSLLGHMVDLGRHPQATYFIQQLVVLETGHQVGTHFLIEEIFQNIDLLVYDKFGTWLVQALISPISPSPVLQRLSSWTVANLSSIYVSQPAVFLAVAVFQRLVVLASNSPSENWSSLLVKFVASLTGVEVEGRPLLITAAINSVGHLLSREIVLLMANIVDVPTKNQVLSVLAKYTIVLKADSFGCIVLKGLHGLI